MISHPYIVIGFWLFLVVAVIVPFLIHGYRKDGESIKRVEGRLFDGGVIEPGTCPPLILSNEHIILKGHPLARVPMRNRFMPERTDPVSSNAMADQILADQAVAEESHGSETDAPAPGEPEYEEPDTVVTVSVGAFSVHMMRGARPCLGEARPDGAEWPLVEIPQEWAEPILALAMEVLRLREGWSVE